MELTQTGEFGLISLIREAIERSRDASSMSWQNLIVSAGDDCAVWKGDKSIQLATTDTMVQGVHFLKGTFKWEDLGHKSMASNLSDVAAMGGIPVYALVSFSLPPDMKTEDVLSLVQGIIDEGAKFGVAIAGGNITRCPVLAISVTLLGKLSGEAMLLRSTAQPGDQVAVTGHLGASAAYVAAFKRKIRTDRATKAVLKHHHFRPQPRIKEGQALLDLGVRTAIDISDGLVSDLTRICEASNVGARIYADRVPVNPALRQALGKAAIDYALTGGEDFELLFTATDEIIRRVRTAIDIPISVIGDITPDHPGQVAVSGQKGERLNPRERGWDHFLK
ncbi:MAG: thiamine-phosphate kinase [Dehalococcoidia bacterium]|nr:thiamine-phosphate kinase [Dehalococcoidia bacterium]